MRLYPLALLALACGQADTDPLRSTQVPIPNNPKTEPPVITPPENVCKAVQDNIVVRINGPRTSGNGLELAEIKSLSPLSIELFSGEFFTLQLEGNFYLPLWEGQVLYADIQYGSAYPDDALLVLHEIAPTDGPGLLLFAAWDTSSDVRLGDSNIQLRYEDDDCAPRGELGCGQVVNRTIQVTERNTEPLSLPAGESGYAYIYEVHNGNSFRWAPEPECTDIPPQRHIGLALMSTLDGDGTN